MSMHNLDKPCVEHLGSRLARIVRKFSLWRDCLVNSSNRYARGQHVENVLRCMIIFSVPVYSVMKLSKRERYWVDNEGFVYGSVATQRHYGGRFGIE